MKKVLLITSLIFITGCASIFNKGPKMKFPSDIKSQCHGSKNEAERLIESKGMKLKEKWNCTVHKVKGEKRFKGVWAWYDDGWEMYVCGLCNGKEIWIGVDPRDNVSLHGPSLIHEFSHWWLMSNYDDWTHNSKLDDVIFNWKHARNVTGSSQKEFRPISVIVTNGNERIHYDLIYIKEK